MIGKTRSRRKFKRPGLRRRMISSPRSCRTLAPGNYTAILSGRNGTTGIGLIEVYDVATGAFAELTNVSTRGFVGTGEAVMIGGFITGGGNGSTQVVVRGLGPTLAQKGVTDPVLADPFLSLRDGNGNLLWNNNDWKDSQQAEIQATGLAPPNDLESAIAENRGAGQLYRHPVGQEWHHRDRSG